MGQGRLSDTVLLNKEVEEAELKNVLYPRSGFESGLR